MELSIITPTLQRTSLVECCKSVDQQSHSDWEHIIQIDSGSMDDELIFRLVHPKRRFYLCGTRHNNFGNSCRHTAWRQASGDYCIYLDDDNFFTRPDALSDVAACLIAENYPDWAIFPILRFGQRFCCLPPGNCRTDSANIVIKREIAQWPNGLEYTMDGLFCEQLKAKFAYSSFPHISPIITVPVQGKGL